MPQDQPPQLPQVTDNTALLNFINSLGLQGAVPAMNALPTVIPVAVVANPVGTVISGALTANTPAYQSSGVVAFTPGAPGAAAVLADTGPLAAGTFDFGAWLTGFGSGTNGESFALEHRNAANAATLATLFFLPVNATANVVVDNHIPDIGYVIALNERLRWIAPATAGFITASCGIRFQIRV